MAPVVVSAAVAAAPKSNNNMTALAAVQGAVVQLLRLDPLNAIAAPRRLERTSALTTFLPWRARWEPNPSPVLLCPTPSYLPQPSGIIIIAIDQMATNTRLGELALCQSQLEKPIRIRNSELLRGKLLG